MEVSKRDERRGAKRRVAIGREHAREHVTRSVELIGPNRASPFFHLTPFFGVILAMVFLGERLTPAHVAGAACIVCGIFIASRRGRAAKKRVAEAETAG